MMKILPVSFSYPNQRAQQKSVGTTSVNFQGCRQLVAITEDSFERNSAKKMYYKIRQYLKLIGDSGSVKDTKIYKEHGKYYNQRTGEKFESDAFVLMSMKKEKDITHLNLRRKYSDTSKGIILLDAQFNKDGQMVKGKFPPDDLFFERQKSNLRRLSGSETSNFIPVGSNDKEWSHISGLLPKTSNKSFLKTYYSDDSACGAYEIFMEFARLYTSIFK